MWNVLYKELYSFFCAWVLFVGLMSLVGTAISFFCCLLSGFNEFKIQSVLFLLSGGIIWGIILGLILLIQ